MYRIGSGAGIEQFEWHNGCLIVTHINERGESEYRSRFEEEEIIAILKLLRFMQDYEVNSVLVPYGHEGEMLRYLSTLLHNKDLAEFQIFQQED